LIELIVVMAVFLFVIGAAVGIFISIVQNQKKVLAEQEFLNQISYVEEYMSKALRMANVAIYDNCIPSGYIYLLTHYNLASGLFRGIKFINQSDNNACQEFFLAGAGTAADPYILKELNSTNGSDAVAITPPNLQFDPMNPIRFSINGSDGSAVNCGNLDQCGASDMDTVQPKVTILMNVKIAGDCPTCNRTIQTTVSQRNLNVNNGQR